MASGAAEKDAKSDLCNATADGKIRLRLCFTWRPTTQDFLTGRDKPTREIRYVKKVQIPAILKPGDFDWRRSRVRKSGLWQSIQGPSSGSFFGNWRVIEIARYKAGDPLPHSQRGGRSLAYQHRVELHSADVTNVLGGGRMIHDEQVGAITNLRGAKSRGIEEAMKQLWPPDGIHPKGLSAKDRNNKVRNQLIRNGSSVPKSLERAIQRVLKVLKAQRPK